MFWGPLGLRSGWGLLLFFVLTGVLGAGLYAGLFRVTGQWTRVAAEHTQERAADARAKAAGRPAPPHAEEPLPVFLAETAQAGAVLLAGLGLSFLERRRFRVYGLPPRRVADVLVGAAVGLGALSLLVVVLRVLGVLVFDRQLLHGAEAVRFGAVWLLIFLLVGLFEEFLFRGYIQFTLMRGLLGLGERLSPARARASAFWLAALFWSLLFSVTHLANAGEDPMGLVMVFAAGILFSYALWRTGALWWGVGFHMAWDWAQSFLFGVPDSGTLSAGRLFQTHSQGSVLLSGGTTGPEGSLLVLPVLLLVALALRLHPQAAQPPVEPEAPAWAGPSAARNPL